MREALVVNIIRILRIALQGREICGYLICTFSFFRKQYCYYVASQVNG